MSDLTAPLFDLTDPAPYQGRTSTTRAASHGGGATSQTSGSRSARYPLASTPFGVRNRIGWLFSIISLEINGLIALPCRIGGIGSSPSRTYRRHAAFGGGAA